MDKTQDIIDSILALYSLAGEGTYLTDYDTLKEGFNSLSQECLIPDVHARRIWGIVSDVYNKEHNTSLLDDPIDFLRNELTDYFLLFVL